MVPPKNIPESMLCVDVGVSLPSTDNCFFLSLLDIIIFLYHFVFFVVAVAGAPQVLLFDAVVGDVGDNESSPGEMLLLAVVAEPDDFCELRSQNDRDLSLSPNRNRDRREGDFFCGLECLLPEASESVSSRTVDGDTVDKSNMEEPDLSFGGGGNICGRTSRTVSTWGLDSISVIVIFGLSTPTAVG